MFYCKECYNNKNLEDMVKSFHKKKHTYYIQNLCKECKSKSRRVNYEKNKEKELLNGKKYKEKNKEKIKIQRKEYHNENKEKIKQYKENNPEIVKKCRKNYYIKHKQDIIKYTKYQKMIKRYLFCKRQKDKIRNLIGCTPTEFKKWITSQFVGIMNIENHGKVWELDHIISQNFFDTSDENDMLICHNWRNIRPCFNKNNKYKKDKIILYENVLQELKIYHYNGSLLFQEGNFFERPWLIAIPNSKKEIHRDNSHPNL